MIAVLPCSVFKPLIDAVWNRVLEAMLAGAEEITAVYNDPRPMRAGFYRRAQVTA